MSNLKLVGYEAIQKKTSWSRATIKRHVVRGEFPAPIKTRGRTLWLESAVDEWIAMHVAASLSPDERAAKVAAKIAAASAGDQPSHSQQKELAK